MHVEWVRRMCGVLEGALAAMIVDVEGGPWGVSILRVLLLGVRGFSI